MIAAMLERPLTLKEAAVRSGRHINTIVRWAYSGQLKLVDPSPLDEKGKRGGRARRCTIEALTAACEKKLVAFKQPRRPHLFRKREKDRERWRNVYAKSPRIKEYKRKYMLWYNKQPQRIAWRRAYDKKRRLAKKAANEPK